MLAGAIVLVPLIISAARGLRLFTRNFTFDQLILVMTVIKVSSDHLLMRIVDLNICCGYFPMVHNDRLLGVLRDSSRDKSDHLRRISRSHSRQHRLPRQSLEVSCLFANYLPLFVEIGSM